MKETEKPRAARKQSDDRLCYVSESILFAHDSHVGDGPPDDLQEYPATPTAEARRIVLWMATTRSLSGDTSPLDWRVVLPDESPGRTAKHPAKARPHVPANEVRPAIAKY